MLSSKNDQHKEKMLRKTLQKLIESNQKTECANLLQSIFLFVLVSRG